MSGKARVAGSVVAGFPSPAEQYLEPPLDLNALLVKRPAATYFVRVEGDSMIDAGIYSGDVVVIDRSLRNPNENEIAMCEHNGEYTIKYVRCHDGKTWLVPDNIDFPEREIKEGDTFNVWGVVVLVIHKATRRR